ncbi:MAG: GWxTD domain-containing protein [Candidatus Eisenbacteria bacterium]
MGEIYRQRADADLEVTWKLLDIRRDAIQTEHLVLTGGRQVPFSIHPDLESLWLGTYYFEIEVKDGSDKARRRFEFRMDETMVSPEGHLEESLELLRIIATKDEINTIESLPEGTRAAGWQRFWEEHDPTPGTPENEFRDAFFQRVRYANEHYGVLEPGWKSDRGRVYIKFGAPDEVESRPSTLEGLAFEIWTYLELRKRFVFVDYDGFGRFELYQPGRS